MRKLVDTLPNPDQGQPFRQIEFVFDCVRVKYYTRGSRGSVTGCYNKFIEFVKTGALEKYKNGQLFYLAEHIDQFTLIKFLAFLESLKKQGGNSYSYAYISANIVMLRQVLDLAFSNQLIPEMPFNVTLPGRGRTTNRNSAYTNDEILAIAEALSQELRLLYQFKHPDEYVKSGIGENPLTSTEGWSNSNTVWFFENVGNCVPIYRKSKVGYNSSKFLTATRLNFGFVGFYHHIKMIDRVRTWMIGTLLFKLALETGINPQSLIDLKIDCLHERNPLSGRPYIRYFKARSTGEKEYPILDYSYGDFETKILEPNQYFIIKTTINQILKLTSRIRSRARESIRDYLFLFQKSKENYSLKVDRFILRSAYHYADYFTSKYELKDRDGQRLELWLMRFRPTRISKLVEAGADVFQVQSEAGHRTFKQTLNYLERERLDFSFQKKLTLSITNILQNKLIVQDVDKKFILHGQPTSKQDVYKSLLASCKNVYDPPNEVVQNRKSDLSQPCARYHMCMFCKNLVFSKEDLPSIYRYYLDIINSSAFKKKSLPNQRYYEKTAEVISKLFDASSSVFLARDLMEAKNIANAMSSFFLDPNVSTGYEI